MMDYCSHAVEDHVSDHSVTEHFAPGVAAFIAVRDHGTTLVVPADELEEQVGALPVDGQVTCVNETDSVARLKRRLSSLMQSSNDGQSTTSYGRRPSIDCNPR